MKEQEKKFNFAIVDDKNQPINNYKIEPPGIFMGRGCNPKLGKIKKRIYPEDITINCSGKHHPVPFIINNHNIIIWKNHKWNNIIENKYVEWLASWKDDITSKVKYIWLSSKSDIGIDKEKNKFDLARKLKDKIDHIR
jgi:DNA topoisomerase-1